MKKQLVTFGLVAAALTSGADIARFPERSFGKKDLSLADSNQEWVKPEPLRLPVVADTTSEVVTELRAGPALLHNWSADSGRLLAVFAGATTSTAGVDSGVPRYYRIKDASRRTLRQGTVSDMRGNGDIRFDDPIIVGGGTVVLANNEASWANDLG